MLAWEKNIHTYNPVERQRLADITADRCNTFRREGFQVFPPIPREAALALASRFDGKPTKVEGTLEHFELDDILAVKELKQLITSPAILSIAAMHLGAVPKVLDVSLWRSNPNTGKPELPQEWHRDYDDYRFCKMFLFLTDVDQDSGPHQFIPGSHRHDFFERYDYPPDMFFISSGRDPQVEKACARLPRMEFVGPAGTCFLENTYGLHRGVAPRERGRLLFQAEYGLTEFEHNSEKMDAIRRAWHI